MILEVFSNLNNSLVLRHAVVMGNEQAWWGWVEGWA